MKLTKKEKQSMRQFVKKVMVEYGETLRLLADYDKTAPLSNWSKTPPGLESTRSPLRKKYQKIFS